MSVLLEIATQQNGRHRKWDALQALALPWRACLVVMLPVPLIVGDLKSYTPCM